MALSCSILLSSATLFAAQPTDQKKRIGKEQPDAAPRPVTTGPVTGAVKSGAPSTLTPSVVLYDQTANANLDAASQDFEAAYNAYDNQAADDFVVTAGGGWNVTTVFAPGDYSAAGVPASMHVTFYQDAAGFPGAVICDFPGLSYVEAPAASFTIAIPGGCLLTAGTKWVSVVATMNFNPSGQWFWKTVTTQTGNPSRWQNPGGGFGTGCSTWNTRTVCLAGQTDPDMAFRIDGSVATCTTNADCSDGNLCNGVETCNAGACQAGTPVNCDDGDFCTIDTCAPATGLCSHGPNPCSDGDSCTLDTCSNGACQHVSPPTLHFCSSGVIALPGSGTVGNASPYPSSIAVAGLGTTANLCSVELNGMTHTFPDDLDIMVVGPLGGASNALVMSDVGGGGDVVNLNLVLKDAAATSLPDSAQLVSGTYKPTNIDNTTDTFSAPAPAPAGSVLSVFNGTNPNGNWSLFAVDDASGDSGTLQSWCVNIVVAGCNLDSDCADGNVCNGTEHCVGGVCQAGTAVNCDDGDACTIDGCTPATGQCTHTPNTCDDGDNCTLDSCDSQSGCAHVSQCQTFCNTDGVAINDGSAPTPATPYPSSISVSGLGTQAVVGSVVLRGLQHTFPDDIDMLLVGPAGGAQNAIIMSDVGGSVAINGIDLTLTDSAASPLPDTGPLVTGTFLPTNVDPASDTWPAPAPAPAGGSALSVFNGDPNGTWSLYVVDDANIDSGTMVAWCLNIRVTSPPCTGNSDCNDNNACTTDACVNGHCVLTPISCDDTNPCTDDFCDQALGCQHSNNSDACDDGNACTQLDACTNGACTGQVIVCNDFNACTLDTCNPASGCVFTDNSAACNDNNVCTTDSCSPASGCVYANNTNACDDGNPCTTGDVCGGGSCHPGAPVPPPAEVQSVAVAGDKATFSWAATPGATGYDVVRGSVGALPVGPGGGDEVPFCGLASNSLVDASVPAPGGALFYVSRARNACGSGTYGTQSNGTQRITTTCP